MTAKHAPLPWLIQWSIHPSGNGYGHIYLVDAEGRKIAAIWGKPEEKPETAQLILDAVEAYTKEPTVRAE